MTRRPMDRLLPMAVISWLRAPWVAAILSLLLHTWLLSTLTESFEFKISQRSGTAPLNTRMILTSSEQEADANYGSKQSLLKQIPPPISQPPDNSLRTVQEQSSAPLEAPDSTRPNFQISEPAKADRLDENQPSAFNDPTRNAAESITNSALSATTATGAGSSAAQPNATLRVVYPPAADLEYDVVRVQRGQASAGLGKLRWKSDGSEYELLMEWSDLRTSMLRQHSVGKFDAMGLAPERYSDKRVNRSEEATHFRRLEGVALFSNNKPQALLQPGIQDPISVLIQLAGILGGDPKRFEIVNVIRVPVADLDGAQLWEMSLEKPLDISVAAANMRAIKLQRKPRNEFDSKLDLWLAPQLGYLPIRIRMSDGQTPDTNFTEFSLRRLPF